MILNDDCEPKKILEQGVEKSKNKKKKKLLTNFSTARFVLHRLYITQLSVF